jgi:hypothetical protein
MRWLPRARVALAAPIAAFALAGAASRAEAQTVRLTLDSVLGRAATSLAVNFGGVDASCTSIAAAGVTCYADPAGAYATWYGTIQFTARLTGMGNKATLRLVGARSSIGTMPAGRLMDGASGVPATPYPVSPAAPITLASAIPNGNTPITRSVGVRVLTSDAASVWSTPIVYSLVVE